MSEKVTSSDQLCATRFEITTIAAIDPGWLVNSSADSDFMHDRGRPGWVRLIFDRLRPTDFEFTEARITTSAYAESIEHGRPTFSPDFSNEYMPLEFSQKNSEDHPAGHFRWRNTLVRIHYNGAFTLHFTASIKTPLTTDQIITSYHQFRLNLSKKIPNIASKIFQMWNCNLAEYATDKRALDRILDHVELYDIVDFDFLVDGKRIHPKDIYKGINPTALRCLAGISRMSSVYFKYSLEYLANLKNADLGSRDDELWIPNAERLIRHHPEHSMDRSKQLYWQDIVTGIDLQCAERSTLNYLVFWTRRLRAKFLDELAKDDVATSRDTTMRSLLREIASCADLYHELPAINRITGSSFFGTLLATIEKFRSTREIQSEVSDSIGKALEIANSIFAEQTAFSARQTSNDSLLIAKASKKTADVATWVALIALIIAILQFFSDYDHPKETTTLLPDSKSSANGKNKILTLTVENSKHLEKEGSKTPASKPPN